MTSTPAWFCFCLSSLLGSVVLPALAVEGRPSVIQAQISPDQGSELSEADQQEIQSVIRQQLEAFQAEDAEAAFSFASPAIQDQFGSAERFVRMVKTRYAPVYRAQQAEFLELVSVRGVPAQQVRLLDPQGNAVTAIYVMEQQSDDSWRISACLLRPMERQGIGV